MQWLDDCDCGGKPVAVLETNGRLLSQCPDCGASRLVTKREDFRLCSHCQGSLAQGLVPGFNIAEDVEQTAIDKLPTKYRAEHMLTITETNGETLASVQLPWFSQLDNYDAAGYTCNSSACWALACFAKPELLSHGANGDYDYYYAKLVEPYGCTTDHSNQTAALDYLGVRTVWRTDVTLAEVAEHVEAFQQPVVIGILHHGDVANCEPAYGGHMLTVHGTYRNAKGELTGLHVSDPNGELDVAHGGYNGMPEQGAALRYSYANLVRRFETDSAGSFTPGPVGWARFLV